MAVQPSPVRQLCHEHAALCDTAWGAAPDCLSFTNRGCSLSYSMHVCGTREKEAIRAAAEIEARRKEEDAERQRQEAYRAAQDRERARVDNILSKTATKTEALEATYLNREHENARIALARQLELNLRRQKVRLTRLCLACRLVLLR